jgi:hypothetical protein
MIGAGTGRCLLEDDAPPANRHLLRPVTKTASGPTLFHEIIPNMRKRYAYANPDSANRGVSASLQQTRHNSTDMTARRAILILGDRRKDSPVAEPTQSRRPSPVRLFGDNISPLEQAGTRAPRFGIGQTVWPSVSGTVIKRRPFSCSKRLTQKCLIVGMRSGGKSPYQGVLPIDDEFRKRTVFRRILKKMGQRPTQRCAMANRARTFRHRRQCETSKKGEENSPLLRLRATEQLLSIGG